ncbi:MAG: glycosyltransferase [Lachnospiraceae bacterium]|nr:glycosyltransferase [Lachnospiraceae bacterium]
MNKKLIVIKWNAYGLPDVEEALRNLGYDYSEVDFAKEELRRDPEFESLLESKIGEENPEFVFSLNFFPTVAHACKKTKVKYISWIYDNPFVLLYSYTVAFPTNYIFVFDKTQYNEFHSNGINTVYYMPLCANAKRLGSYSDIEYFKTTKWFNKADIAFVGSLYTEDHQFYERLEHISDRTRGYLEGLMEAQSHVYGYNFIEECLPKDIIKEMQKDLPLTPNEDGVETEEWLFAQYVINRRITGLERTRMLNLIGTKYKYDLYTKNESLKLPNCFNHGQIDPHHGAPHVFKQAKINLNFTLKSIISGIPLRAFEIIGSGGFLLTNYQADFDDCFMAGEDYVYFESPKDMMEKIEYLLSHEKERSEIARNGYEKMLKEHTYEKRLEDMINAAFEDD